VHGNEAFIHFEWLDKMYERARSVARVFDPATGERLGTGYLARGSDLCDNWSEELVFVTNSHVISDNPADEAPLGPGDGSAEFTRLPDRPKVRLGEILFTSPRFQLDVTMLTIDAPPGSAPMPLQRYQPILPQEGDPPQRIYVMGHPKGAELAVSMYDNSLKAYVDDYVHYRSPTEGGSSGSPVFTRRWKVFALHHRSRESLQVNEGLLIKSIRAAMAKVG
jgi:hypothetical protein